MKCVFEVNLIFIYLFIQCQIPMDKRTKQVKTNIQWNEWGHDSVEIITY